MISAIDLGAATQPSPVVQPIASPFSRDGEAFVFQAPNNKVETLVWELDDVVPGEPYSLSFFFQNRDTQDPRQMDAFALSIGDSGHRIYQQTLYGRNYPQFFATDVVFESTSATVALGIKPGLAVIFGDFGRAVEVADLADFRDEHYSLMWPPTLRLPDVYRGLRKFAIEVKMWAGRAETGAVLNTIEVQAGMNIAAAKLPRILPGENTLRVAKQSAGPSANLRVEMAPRRYDGKPNIILENDPVIPADGATFGRVMVSATDAEGDLISGHFFRLRAPDEVSVFPYVRAISDWESLQVTREYHVTSLVPGEYVIGVEFWNGVAWEDSDRTLKVVFSAAEAPVPEFLRSEYSRSWLQPRVAASAAERGWVIDLDLEGEADEFQTSFGLDSPLSPRVDWRVKGPVDRMGINADFQPAARTLNELAGSLRDRVARNSEAPSRDFALTVEEYVALGMEGILPDPFLTMDYQSYGHLHREGRGWCNQFARAVHALMVPGGLESRLRGVPSHVAGEVRTDELSPMLVDAMLQVAVVDAEGGRMTLDQLGRDGVRVVGADVSGHSRRDAYSGYLLSPVPTQNPWMRKDADSISYRNAYLDDEVFSISLHSWEELTWSSGSVASSRMRESFRRVAENQTILTQTARLFFPEFEGDPVLLMENIQRTDSGNLAPVDANWGQVSFGFHTPVEVDNLLVSLDGLLWGGGQMAISLRPDLNRPLLRGFQGFQTE